MGFTSIRRTKKDMLADLDCEPVSSRMAGHSTLEYTLEDGTKVIRFHKTDIIRIAPDGTVTLNTGGWKTPTTKKRMNEYLPSGVSIYQEKGMWWLCKGGSYWEKNIKRYPFVDGVQVTPDGTIVGSDPQEAERVKKLNKQISKYIRELKKLDKVPQPDLGDCLLCKFPGKPICLEDHLEETYIHGTLLLKAMEEYGCTPFVIRGTFDNLNMFENRFQLTQAVRRYFKRHLGLSI